MTGRRPQMVYALPPWLLIVEAAFWLGFIILCVVGLAIVRVVKFFVRRCQSVLQST